MKAKALVIVVGLGVILIALVALNFWFLNKKLETQEEDLRSLRGKVADLQATLQGVTSELNELKEVREERDSLQEELVEIRKALEKQRKEIAAGLKAISGRLENLREELAELKAKMGGLELKLSQIETLATQQIQPQIQPADSTGEFLSLLSQKITSLEDSLKTLKTWSRRPVRPVIKPTQSFFWKLRAGWLVWSAGKPWDLSTPYVGVSLLRKKWGLELQGGVTPWSRKDPQGNRGDAVLSVGIDLFPDRWMGIKAAVFGGWEFLTSGQWVDQWTMKTLGFVLGPRLKWKFLKGFFFEGFAGYSVSKISSLTEPDAWRSGGMVSLGIIR